MQNIPSWSWSYGSWIYNYLSIQCLSPLKLWVQIPSWWGVLDTTLCNKVCRWLATRQMFFPGTLVSSTNKTDGHDIPVTKILLKVALNIINQPPNKICKISHYFILIVVYDIQICTKRTPENGSFMSSCLLYTG